MSKTSRAIAELIWGVNKKYITSYKQLVDMASESIDKVNVKVYRENDKAVLPAYGKDGDACMDVTATSIEYDDKRNRFICHTGLHFELPEDYEMELRPRSSNTKFRVIIANAPGTLDAGYRGELLVIFTPLDVDDISSFPYKEGDRVCQLLVRRRERINWVEVNSLEELSSSERGTGGFGSTKGIQKEG